MYHVWELEGWKTSNVRERDKTSKEDQSTILNQRS